MLSTAVVLPDCVVNDWCIVSSFVVVLGANTRLLTVHSSYIVFGDWYVLRLSIVYLSVDHLNTLNTGDRNEAAARIQLVFDIGCCFLPFQLTLKRYGLFLVIEPEECVPESNSVTETFYGRFVDYRSSFTDKHGVDVKKINLYLFSELFTSAVLRRRSAIFCR